MIIWTFMQKPVKNRQRKELEASNNLHYSDLHLILTVNPENS